jgi:catechol 2,3-dioxygenase-like lactoylglutathione lyase family enzyme
MERPAAFAGLRHVALFVEQFEACEHFYIELLGMREEWRPDADNLYLCSGCDNLALHRAPEPIQKGSRQKLDHIGFVIDDQAAVDEWYEFLQSNGVAMLTAPRTHRDGARSFYCQDPDGTMVQLIWHPPISGLTFSRS